MVICPCKLVDSDMISENDIEMDMEFCMYARREIYSW